MLMFSYYMYHMTSDLDYIREERLDTALKRAVRYFEAFIHDNETAALLDDTVVDNFEGEKRALQAFLLSVDYSKRQGNLKNGFKVCAVIEENEDYISIGWTPVPETDVDYQVIAFNPSKSGQDLDCFTIDCTRDAIDNESDDELVKTFLHEIGHAMLHDGRKQLADYFWQKKLDGEIDARKFCTLDSHVSRNAELVCDGIADFARPQQQMIEWRKNASLKSTQAGFKQLKREKKLGPEWQDVIHEVYFDSEKAMAPGGALEILSKALTKPHHNHPHLAVFRANAETCYEALQPLRTARYLNSVYDTDISAANAYDQRFNPQRPRTPGK